MPFGTLHSRSFRAYLLNERYENLFVQDVDRRRVFIDRVWEMVNAAYASQGGIMGSGFSSKEDMIQNLPMWKIKRRGDEILAVVFYKDKAGRKIVALATNGEADGKEALKSIFREEFRQHRSWTEMSGLALKFADRVMGEELKEFELTPEEVQDLLPKDRIVPSGNGNRYFRDIGGSMVEKLALGTPNRHINMHKV